MHILFNCTWNILQDRSCAGFSNLIKLPTCVGSEILMICNKPSSFQEKNVYLYVIDYIKAFDCVDHNKRFSQSIQLLSCVQLFANPYTTAQQASLSITNSQSLLKLMSIESVSFLKDYLESTYKLTFVSFLYFCA